MMIVRTIKPGTPFKSSVFREEMQAAMQKIGTAARDDFQRTVATWNHQPKFKLKIQLGPQSIVVEITTNDKIYGYIDQGTRVRYATMTPDFKAKTTPDVVQAFPGKGGLFYVSRKHPRPGIQARHFTEHIAATYKPEMQREVKNALARAARRSGHGRG